MKNYQRRLVSIGGIALLQLFAGSMLATASNQEAITPFISANRHPLIQIYGLPEAGSVAKPASGESQLQLQFEAASHFINETEQGETLFLDGESHRSSLFWQYGIDEHWAISLLLPHVKHTGGGMDSFIDEWHHLFGLPEGDRPRFDRDQLLFSYQGAQGEALSLQDSASGIADIRLAASYHWQSTSGQLWALRGQLKLPSGDEAELTGSNTTDVALSLQLGNNSLLGSAWQWQLSAGFLWMEEAQLLSAQREDWVFTGSALLAYPYSERISFKVQLDGHTAFYDSALNELSEGSLQLLLGGSISLTPQWHVDLAVSEDVAVNTAPDVVFMLGLRWLSAK